MAKAILYFLSLLPCRTRLYDYGVTDQGLRIALFFTRSYARVLRPGLSQVTAADLPDNLPLQG